MLGSHHVEVGMLSATRYTRPVGLLVVIAVCLGGLSTANAQITRDDFVTGLAAEAWERWQIAMTAILARDAEAAETAFGQLLEAEPSAFRIALMAERTVMRTGQGGAVLLLEQDAESNALQANGQRVTELLEVGREQMNQADDGWYFAAIGRFDVANANFQALLASDPDPVALLEFADRARKRLEILDKLTVHPVIGESAREMLKLLARGELMIKADPTRIKKNLAGLGGPPRAYENSLARLKDSGEYAIPFLVQFLRDAEKKHLNQAILRCLPQIDRPALNPLVMSFRMTDHATKRYLLRAAGKIGYTQAVPYLLQLRESPDTPPEVGTEVEAALAGLAARGVHIDPELSAAESFYRLAEAYYDDDDALAADPRLDSANVWYWRDDLLQNVEVPTPVFNEIMCMRCCEEALLLDSDFKPALALWLAANFRREAQLPEGELDRTRPADYPIAAYFAQSAGAEYCMTALARGVDDGDPAVALGAIEALRKTGGPASVVGDEAGRQPLAEALSFPDRMVRIRAALALGRALPTQVFHNYQNLMPVLSEALMLHGGARNALVVDPDEATGNLVAGALRAEGYEVLSDAELFHGLDKVRRELPGIDVICLASDVKEPALSEALSQLRSEFRFAATPTIIISKPADRQLVRDLVRADHRLGAIVAGEDVERIKTVIAKVSRAVGAKPIDADSGVALALEAAEVLRLLALTNNSLFDVQDAEPALIVALATTDDKLRITVAHVLGHLGTSTAQEAIAGITLDENEPQEMRVSMFEALAQAAKRRGNYLGPDSVQRIIAIAESEQNMVIREAASQTLGALSLPGNPASVIIRNQYGG